MADVFLMATLLCYTIGATPRYTLLCNIMVCYATNDMCFMTKLELQIWKNRAGKSATLCCACYDMFFYAIAMAIAMLYYCCCYCFVMPGSPFCELLQSLSEVFHGPLSPLPLQTYKW